ncbi:hypothetical protein M422DRAFT_253905 [Sphaerobolus stellatus SS14]|uniref:Uncharacterized protein n=1 Tax=Sphaerobolus stellatus (strain SS14) TaxID=990650 RepID=A0A0C9VWS5_SPHS4|nr:hypothetical protein M422DRAFT_253905 [Sphaerobolus stellatus SS14]
MIDAEETQKRGAEALKAKLKADVLHNQEQEHIRSADTKVFTSVLSRYTCKDDLKDIAACFHFTEDTMKGTNTQHLSQIKAYMEANPVLQANPRFAALYGQQCGGKVAESPSVESPEVEEDCDEPESSEEDTDSDSG